MLFFSVSVSFVGDDYDLGVVFSCSPDATGYMLSVVFRDDSSSQSLSIYESESGTLVYSCNGYGKDNTVFYDKLCLKTQRYTIVVQDGYVFSFSSYVQIEGFLASRLLFQYLRRNGI